MVDRVKLRKSQNVIFVNRQITKFQKYLMRVAVELSNGQNSVNELQISTQSFLLSMALASQGYIHRSTGFKPAITNSLRTEMRKRTADFVGRFLANYEKVTNVKIRQADLTADQTSTFDWMFERDSSDLMIGMYNTSLNTLFNFIPKNLDIKKVFTTMEDDRVCEDCDSYADTEFDLDDDSAPDLPDDTHPNCRCWYVIRVNGEDMDEL